jgi:uncharacterized protein (DUF1697 family)
MIYVSMLRGINVGGHKRIKMDQLRASFQALGFEQVKTYIQSGNVVFKTGKLSPAGLSKRIEERILKDFGFPVSVISRTSDAISWRHRTAVAVSTGRFTSTCRMEFPKVF